MALTEAQQLSVCKIMGMSPYVLTIELDHNSNNITAEVETEVIAEIARWETAGKGTKFGSIEPNLKNFGRRKSYEDEKNDIRKNIAILLFFDPERFFSTGSRLVRS